MAHRVVKKFGMTFQPEAMCTEAECGWKMDPHVDARQRGRDHVRRTGHGVQVIVRKVDIYRREL